ncbi:MAG: citrate/2-methylcitrate synthase [Myxococcota bacterium]
MEETISATEAARRLGVKPATLYTYVSRGWLHSLPGDDRRRRRYLADEVEALRARAEAARGHRAVAAHALRWGQPVIDTAISDISPEGPRYRGLALADAITEGFEAVAARLWGVPSAPWPTPPPPDIQPGPPDQDLHRRLLRLLASDASAAPPMIVRRLALGCACSVEDAARAAKQPTISRALAAALGAAGHHEAIDAALVVCAEHELNASTFAARVVASTGASLAMSLCAAMAALSGERHGACSERVEDVLASIGHVQDVEAVLEHQLDVAQALPGCGHRLYPGGDPRARVLIDLVTPIDVDDALLEEIEDRGLPAPNLDLGLVVVRRALGLPRGSAQAIFAVGRTAGWIAHVLEERERNAVIRPRARYTGP